MPSAKAIEDKIITKLKALPEEGKKEVLEYINNLKSKRTEKTLRLLKKTAGRWKGLIDTEKLKRDIYSDRLISTRLKVKF
jgi:Mg/Co/Ni transporter MgtE